MACKTVKQKKMKKLMLALALIVSTTSFGQKCNDHVLGLGTSAFVSNYGESGLNLHVAVLSPTAKWWPSFNADLYNARKPESKAWPVAQVGARLNVPVIRGFYLSAGPKYVTQGRQNNGYNQWVLDGAATGVFVLVQNKTGVMWLKTSLQYTSTPQHRLFFLAGLQFALTN